ncbi:MAG: class 1 fructose-bisphosphatase [Acidiphilium sp.]
MTHAVRLTQYLDLIASRHGGHYADVGAVVLAIAAAGRNLAQLLAKGGLGDFSGPADDKPQIGRDGDVRKAFDVLANTILRDALVAAPVAVLASEEDDAPVVLDPKAPLAVAIDPLDGSSNIDTNAPIGTIFTILPADFTRGTPERSFLCSGNTQLAAGFLIYGPHTALVLTLGYGTLIFTLDPVKGNFISSGNVITLPRETREYAINGSNYRHWNKAIQRYISDCLLGAAGPRGIDFNTRWIASMVAEAYRILIRGGVYLYPGDTRETYRDGRLRLLYEAFPIAFLIEQAGGAATDGRRHILDLVPENIHQRIPLIFGTAGEVERIVELHRTPYTDNSPLFGNRGLFRQHISPHVTQMDGLACR